MKAFRVDAYFFSTFLFAQVGGQKTFGIHVNRRQVSSFVNAYMRISKMALWIYLSEISVVRVMQ